MPDIDKRLNKPDCEINITEDLNRVLELVDGIDARVKALEGNESGGGD